MQAATGIQRRRLASRTGFDQTVRQYCYQSRGTCFGQVRVWIWPARQSLHSGTGHQEASWREGRELCTSAAWVVLNVSLGAVLQLSVRMNMHPCMRELGSTEERTYWKYMKQAAIESGNCAYSSLAAFCKLFNHVCLARTHTHKLDNMSVWPEARVDTVTVTVTVMQSFATRRTARPFSKLDMYKPDVAALFDQKILISNAYHFDILNR